MIRSTNGGEYHLICNLGKGNFGETYLAIALHLPEHPQCVLKKFNPEFSDRFFTKTARIMFDTEIEVLSQLKHDQIPRWLDHFEFNQQFYLVYEYIPGDNLNDEIKREQRLSESKVRQILQQILEILIFVHQHGLIHRDINPKNLIRRSTDQKIVLIDFGLVQRINHPERKITVGTDGYRPMEQTDGKARFCSDIYATGITAIAALTGICSNFPKNSDGEIIWRDQVQVSDDFANIISTMVRSYFGDRYQSASAALQALLHIQTEPNKLINAPPIKINYHQTKKFAIAPQFDNVGSFSEGRAEVTIRNKWGYIDPSGELVIAGQFNFAEPFFEGLAQVTIGGKNGFIDKNGNLVIQPQFANTSAFCSGLAAVQINNKWGFIDQTGNLVIPAIFDGVSGFSECFDCTLSEVEGYAQGLVGIQIQDKWGFINYSGNIVISPQFDSARIFSEGLAAVKLQQKWGYIDQQGNLMIQPQFEQAGNFLAGLTVVKRDNKYGYINQNSQVIIPFIFDAAEGFYEGLAAVKVGEQVGYINQTGNFVIPPQFPEINEYFIAYPFAEGLAAVEIDGKWGFIDQNGNIAIAPQFDDANSFSEGLAAVEIDYLWGYIPNPLPPSI